MAKQIVTIIGFVTTCAEVLAHCIDDIPQREGCPSTLRHRLKMRSRLTKTEYGCDHREEDLDDRQMKAVRNRCDDGSSYD